MCFTVRWLNELSPDSVVHLDSFHFVRVDRNTTEGGKTKGGGIVVFVNERWCKPGYFCVKEQRCTIDLSY